MPFQSEKQRRFLHANHPEIAKRWERDYANGGILDINESKEIIDDGGNEIELTDYNAAFDDPNDLSTGVKSLFQAKEGGNVRLGPHKATDLLVKKTSTGERPKYQPPGHRDSAPSSSGPSGPPGGGATSLGSGRDVAPSRSSSQDKSPGHPANQPSVSTKSSTQAPDQGGHSRFKPGSGYYGEPITNKTQDTGEWSGDYEDEFFVGPRWEAYNDKEWVNVNRNHYEEMKRVQLEKMKNRGIQKLFLPALMILGGIPPKVALKSITVNPNDLMTAVQYSLPVMKAKKDLIASLEKHKGNLLKDVNIHNPNEMVNLEKTTDFTKTMNELKDLTKKEVKEDTKDDGPGLPPQLGGASTEEMATEYGEYGMSDLDRIRAGQAKRAMLVEKGIIQENAQDNPIVSGTEMDIIALGNRGGLANLFRVKNQ